MFGLISRNPRFPLRNSSILHLGFLQNPPTLSFLRCISSNGDVKEQSFTVSYLINSCGLSLDFALSASKLVHFQNPKKPDLVLASLKKLGFSPLQISVIIKRNPQILVCKPEKTILRKLGFLQSKGFTSSDIVSILCYCPNILHRSFDNHIVPSYNFLKDLLGSDEKTVAAIRRCNTILYMEIRTVVATNVSTLIDSGVPASQIVKLIQFWPKTFFYLSRDKLKLIVEKVKEMGVDPKKHQFIAAVCTFGAMSKSTWDKKVDVLKGWNLSEEEIFLAFRKYPFLMTRSENKIMAIMDFVVNDLGWESSYIVKNPAIVGYSLEKKLIPRASVLRFLMLNGLVKKDFRSFNFFACDESKFMQKFVNSHVEAPELLKLYGEKLAHSR